MLRIRTAALSKALARSYATSPSPHALVFLEHRDGELDSASLSALTAASRLGGKVTGFLTGAPDQVPGVLDKAKKIKGLDTVLHSTSPQYSTPLPEIVAPLLEKVLSGGSPFTHVVSAHSSSAKSILPRVAAKLDVPAVSDIISVEHDISSDSTTFARPIYAGNAISTVRAPSSIPIKFFTVRSTAFPAAVPGEAEAETEVLDPVEVSDSPSYHISTSLSKSDRPDLGVASRVVSGGRALKNAETFRATLYPLADALGAAVGASRAAVDAGYADNSLQVGQTGKVVAPELYMALGISGAIQHLAGMKDSKLIVAINKVVCYFLTCHCLTI
jgi:electron transfer flavoprotein alpha subunit